MEIRGVVVWTMKNIDVPMRKVKLVIDLVIRHLENTLTQISMKYHSIIEAMKRNSENTRRKVYEAIKVQVLKSVDELWILFHSYEQVKEAIKFYHELKSWITDVFIPEAMKVINRMKRYYEKNFSLFIKLHERLQVYYLRLNLIIREKYEEILTYPFIKYILSVTEATVEFCKSTINYYLKNYNIRTLLELTMSRMNIYVSTFIRMVSDYETTRAVDAMASSMGFTQKIDEFTTVDFNYSYDTSWNDSDVKLSLGIKNAFDEEAPLVYDAANFSYDPKHHDPRGRMVYLGFKLSTN